MLKLSASIRKLIELMLIMPPVMQVQARPLPPSRDGLSLNPEGRGVSYNKPVGVHGSMESLNSTQSSINSFGSTGSYSSSKYYL